MFRNFLFAAILIPTTLIASGSEDNMYGSMNAAQLKEVVGQLQAELELVKERLRQIDGAAPASAPVPAKAASKAVLLDDHEGKDAWNTPGKGGWWVGGDQHGMGTTVDPDPYKPQAGGCPESPGHSGGIYGHLGPMEEPWTWASLGYHWWKDGQARPQDLTKYRGISFWVKGDGNPIEVKLEKASITDHANFVALVETTKAWKKVALPFTAFKQPDWGNRVKAAFDDVKSVNFAPTLHESDYRFNIDQLSLVP